MLVAVVLVAAFVPAAAVAGPGDPPVTPLEPADGATVPTDPEGLPVSFACPQFVILDLEDPFDVVGFADDYGAFLATSPRLDAGGRLADSVAGTSGIGFPRPSDSSVCDARLGVNDFPSPQTTPGTYWWQVWRPVGSAGFEVGPVRRMVVRTNAKADLRLPRRAYAGYPLLVKVALEGAAGAKIGLQRRVRGRWKEISSKETSRDDERVVASLPRGRHTLRAVARIGTDRVASENRSLTVRRAQNWQTGPHDDGGYRERRASSSLRFRVVRRGRQIRQFFAQVPTQCPTAGQTNPNIADVTFPPVRLAPDGSFVSIGRLRGSSVELIGRLEGRAARGYVYFAGGGCLGSTQFKARRTGP